MYILFKQKSIKIVGFFFEDIKKKYYLYFFDLLILYRNLDII